MARLNLAVTKTDPRGRGKVRGQRCICDLGPVATASCVACGLARQRAARVEEGATLDSPLFPCSGGGFPSKDAAVRTLQALLTPVEGNITGHTPRRMGAQLMVELGLEDSVVMWFGRWGSAAVLCYIEDARARSRAGSELWWTALAGSRPMAWGIAPPGNAQAQHIVTDAMKEFIVEESRRAALTAAAGGALAATAAPEPMQKAAAPDAVHFVVNRDTMTVHIVCPKTPGATLCLRAFTASGADWERAPRKAQGTHKGKAFDPCSLCRGAAVKRGWLGGGEETAVREVPAPASDSSDSEC